MQDSKLTLPQPFVANLMMTFKRLKHFKKISFTVYAKEKYFKIFFFTLKHQC